MDYCQVRLYSRACYSMTRERPLKPPIISLTQPITLLLNLIILKSVYSVDSTSVYDYHI